MTVARDITELLLGGRCGPSCGFEGHVQAFSFPGLPKALNSRNVLKSYRGPYYTLRYIP